MLEQSQAEGASHRSGEREGEKERERDGEKGGGVKERDVEIEKHSKARVDSSTDQVRAEIEAKEIKSLLYPPQIAGDKVP